MTTDQRQPRARRGPILILALAMAATASSPEPAAAAGRRVLFHLQTGITQDDNPMCAAFNVALAAVESGDEVEMFFDAGAVFDLQDAPTRGGGEGAASQPTSQPASGQGPAYNLKYELPDKLKGILGQQFGLPAGQLPATYFDYLRMLKGKGVEVTFNGAMAHLVSLSDSVTGSEAVTDVATPLDLKQMLEHRARAAIYLVY